MKSKRKNDSLTDQPRRWFLVHTHSLNMPQIHALPSNELTIRMNDRGNIKDEHLQPLNMFSTFSKILPGLL